MSSEPGPSTYPGAMAPEPEPAPPSPPAREADMSSSSTLIDVPAADAPLASSSKLPSPPLAVPQPLPITPAAPPEPPRVSTPPPIIPQLPTAPPTQPTLPNGAAAAPPKSKAARRVPSSVESRTTYIDSIVVIRHGLEATYGSNTEVYHALSTHGGGNLALADKIIKLLQSNSVALRRYPSHPAPARGESPTFVHVSTADGAALDAKLSPYYTYLCGNEKPPLVPLWPSGDTVPWTKVPSVFLDVADLINARARRMWPSENEMLNSVLVVAQPPDLPPDTNPKVVLQPNCYYALLYLGSDGTLKFRPIAGAGKGKQGELVVQHGDVVGIRTGPLGMEIVPKLDGFGFMCFARQVFKSAAAPANGVAVSSTSVQISSERPSVPPPQPLKQPRKRSSIISTPSHATTAAALGALADAALAVEPAPVVKISLDGWYLGGFPLCPTDPIRVLAPLKTLRCPLDWEALAFIHTSLPKPAQKGPGRKGKAKRPATEDEQDSEDTSGERRWTGAVTIEAIQIGETYEPPGWSEAWKDFDGLKAPSRGRKRKSEVGTEDGTPRSAAGAGRKKARQSTTTTSVFEV